MTADAALDAALALVRRRVYARPDVAPLAAALAAAEATGDTRAVAEAARRLRPTLRRAYGLELAALDADGRSVRVSPDYPTVALAAVERDRRDPDGERDLSIVCVP